MKETKVAIERDGMFGHQYIGNIHVDGTIKIVNRTSATQVAYIEAKLKINEFGHVRLVSKASNISISMWGKAQEKVDAVNTLRKLEPVRIITETELVEIYNS
jgi:hypothetical protein